MCCTCWRSMRVQSVLCADVYFIRHYGAVFASFFAAWTCVVVSVVLVVCSLSVFLFMCLFLLYVLCLTVLVNCLLNLDDLWIIQSCSSPTCTFPRPSHAMCLIHHQSHADRHSFTSAGRLQCSPFTLALRNNRYARQPTG